METRCVTVFAQGSSPCNALLFSPGYLLKRIGNKGGFYGTEVSENLDIRHMHTNSVDR